MRLGFYFFVLFLLALSACGRAYFPIELKTISRSERLQKQASLDVKIIPMTSSSIMRANLQPYVRRVIEAGDLNKPAKLIPAKNAIKPKHPAENDPGTYLIGVGDTIKFTKILRIPSNGMIRRIERLLYVKEEGLINFYEFGNIKAVGLSETQLEDLVYQKLSNVGETFDFELQVADSRKKITIIVDGIPNLISYRTVPMYLRETLALASAEGINLFFANNIDTNVETKIQLLRDNEEYELSFKDVFSKKETEIRLFPEDKIILTRLNYRPENVLVIGETGAQTSIPINSALRPTLSDTIFGNDILNKFTSDFSQIYVLRKGISVYDAYHLDITNPVRVSLASKFEMRPDDIVFVATQPLSLYSRTLSQLLGSVGLTREARDAVKTELGQ